MSVNKPHTHTHHTHTHTTHTCTQHMHTIHTHTHCMFVSVHMNSYIRWVGLEQKGVRTIWGWEWDHEEAKQFRNAGAKKTKLIQ